ncbi:catalase [Paenibacillus yanchengensis]|uniref:Catalase n=1 Tax=Paenibacillus yanchengensis TaxID=2035833 RepID=A0ABW4YJ62_9BACL
MSKKKQTDEKHTEQQNAKHAQLESYRSDGRGQAMTTNQGVKISEDEFSLKAGERGPTLMEDFHFREKMTHFDHERIPERVVHARGFGVHGQFELYESMAQYTKADFLQRPGEKTDVFVRFSTVAGSRGSAETVRDVRGFATKFYTKTGNFDLVGNNMPVFFMQDAIKFPDFIHALKPEPHNEMPQAASAHDTFWDYIANNQESAHMVMWVMSDRAIPRSFRMMEGFGVHAFRFVNDNGEAHFVKFHWKPLLGVHSLIWKEAQRVAGLDPDYNRRDLWENIEEGNFPAFELGVQILPEKDEFKFDFDILDATKIWPEENIPVQIIGKMTLNRNVDNVFAETEQVAFHVGNVVPGIDFTNDPLLQGRLFSYTDTQLIRLGGPNFHEIPINRPICPFHNNQRDGYGRRTIDVGQVAYQNNSLANNDPHTVTDSHGGYVHYQEKVEGNKIRARGSSFKDHFTQATLFWNSMSPVEKQHIKDAFSFELGKVKSPSVRTQVLDMFDHVSHDLINTVAANLGMTIPVRKNNTPPEQLYTKTSPALSMENTTKLPTTLRAAVIIADQYCEKSLAFVTDNLNQAGIQPIIISEHLGPITGAGEQTRAAQDSFLTSAAAVFDAIVVIGGANMNPNFATQSKHFIQEGYDQYKPIIALAAGTTLVDELTISEQPGIVTYAQLPNNAEPIITAISERRFWNRPLL